MNKQLKYVLFFLLINKMFAQVSPYYVPFNQLNSSIGVNNSNEFYNNDLPISFIENASFEVGFDRKIYSLAILFDSTYTGYLKIDKFNIPDGAMLFIFSSD